MCCSVKKEDLSQKITDIDYDVLFSEEGRLAWMCKDKVDSEEFLLGRRIDNNALNDPEPATESKCRHFNCIFLFFFLHNA